MSNPYPDESFNVVTFDADDRSTYVARGLDVFNAVHRMKRETTNVAAQLGAVKRIIITDAGDLVVAEWIYGRGIVYPKGLAALKIVPDTQTGN